MALDSENGIGATMLMQPAGNFGGYGYGVPYAVPMYGNSGGFGGFGGDWSSFIILFLFAMMFGGGFGGYGMGGFGGFGGCDFPWLLTGQQQISNNTNTGFRDQMINDNITSVRDGIGSLSTQICGGFGDVQLGIAGINQNLCQTGNGIVTAVNGAQNALTQQLYTNQISDLERSFAAQTANTQGMNAIQGQLAQCCCDNRAATADVKYTIATEACNTRAANTANTQAILDKLCALELDGYKRENDNLRQQLNMASLAASQAAQTATIQRGLENEVDAVYNRLKNCPVPSTPVFGNQPIFTCAQNVAGSNCGCGCGNGFNGFAN